MNDVVQSQPAAAATLDYRGPATARAMPEKPVMDVALEALDRYRWFVFGLIAVIYLAGFNGQWHVGADSALYVSLGRNLATGEGYTYQGEPHTWVEPGLPLLIAASFKVFGVDVLWPVNLVMLGLGLVSLFLIYRLFERHAGRPVAVMITGLTGIAEVFFQYVYEIRTDIPFFVGLLTFLIGYERLFAERIHHEWKAWLLMLVGLWVMMLFRPVVMTFLGALFLACAWHAVRGPRRLRHVGVAVLAIACLMAFRAVDPRRANVGDTVYRESVLRDLLTERPRDVAVRTLTKFLPKVAQELFPEAIFAFEFGDGIDQAMCGFFVLSSIWLLRRRVLWSLWIGATFAQVLIWWPLTRYFMPVLPFMLFAAHVPIRAFVTKLERLDRKYAWALVAGCTTALVLVNAAHVLRGVYYQHRRPFLTHYMDGKHVGTTELGAKMRDVVRDEDVVLADPHRVLSYFSGGKRVLELPKYKQGPPSPQLLAAFDRKVLDARNVYIVLPAHGRLQQHMSRLGLAAGAPVLTATGYTMNRAVKVSTTQPSILPLQKKIPVPTDDSALPSDDDEGA